MRNISTHFKRFIQTANLAIGVVFVFGGLSQITQINSIAQINPVIQVNLPVFQVEPANIQLIHITKTPQHGTLLLMKLRLWIIS